MPRICVTRAVKNAKFLQATAPQIIPADEPLEGFTSLVPLDQLQRLHLLREDEVQNAKLKKFVRTTDIPRAGILPAAALFAGSLVFARITFNTPGGAVAVSAADVATAVQYATLAVVPISAYASQYGTNSLSVDQTVLTFSVNLAGTQYNDQTLQQWVNTLAAQPGLPVNPCIVVLSPQGVTNTDGDINQGILGYHGKANVPYCFCNVFGQNLTIADQANVYALQLSHEIAEMTVDPEANNSNPEVCDPCGPNCQTPWLDFFGGQGNAYLQTTQTLPPTFAYTFFINAIATPGTVSQCPPTSTVRVLLRPAQDRQGDQGVHQGAQGAHQGAQGGLQGGRQGAQGHQGEGRQGGQRQGRQGADQGPEGASREDPQGLQGQGQGQGHRGPASGPPAGGDEHERSDR